MCYHPETRRCSNTAPKPPSKCSVSTIILHYIWYNLNVNILSMVAFTLRYVLHPKRVIFTTSFPANVFYQNKSWECVKLLVELVAFNRWRSCMQHFREGSYMTRVIAIFIGLTHIIYMGSNVIWTLIALSSCFCEIQVSIVPVNNR